MPRLLGVPLQVQGRRRLIVVVQAWRENSAASAPGDRVVPGRSARRPG
jgi:hypothetical protein